MGRRMRNARHHGPTHAQQQRDGSITDAGSDWRHSGMSRRRNGEWWRIRRHREPIAARGTLRGARWDLQRLFHGRVESGNIAGAFLGHQRKGT